MAQLLDSAFPVILPLPLCYFICLRGLELFLEHPALVVVLEFSFVLFSFSLYFFLLLSNAFFPSGITYMLLYILQLRPIFINRGSDFHTFSFELIVLVWKK